MLEFNRTFVPRYGEHVEILPGLSRVTCNNPGPLTFFGTNTFLIGQKEVAVLDPGPLDEAHLSSLMEAIGSRPVKAILVSHTHIDHSPLAQALQDRTGAPIWGSTEHRRAEAFKDMPENPMQASADASYNPARILKGGDRFTIDGMEIETLDTPGHTVNHIAFRIPEMKVVLTADHVMAWSTTVVAPPDGSMSDYMASLELLTGFGDHRMFPAHGGEILNPSQYLPALKAHRLQREAAVMEQVAAGVESIPEMVAVIYKDVDPKLHGAAALNVLAHLEDLVVQKRVSCELPISLSGKFIPA
ncbi:MBL fold metallo-hydrolase [Rhodobacteraceae bacterium RKSG542]|uniref:MBL fold metallo-hydrolase n=1 Tax=Pseudovibrio flavus TaxID=2529854 RepID=UPI0035290A9E|nr:MBL fold metallo-hydrolase [Pseudovibrio flavus]